MKKTVITMITILLVVIFTCSGVCAENRTLVIAGTEWEPYYGETLPENGFFTVIIRTAFQRAGYTLNLKFVPWKRAIEKGKKGKYDSVMGAYYTEERSQHFTYSDAVYESLEVFFCKKERSISYKSFKDLAKYKIGALRGWSTTKTLKNENLNVKEVSNDSQNLKKLMNGRIDLFCATKVSMLNLIQSDYPQWKGKVKIIQPPLFRGKIYMIISKKNPTHKKIAKDLNLGLKRIRDEGTFNRIIEKYGFQ